MIEEWRNAFSLFEEISGFELDAVNGNQSQVVNEFLQQVWKKVRNKNMKVAKCLNGWPEKVKDVGMSVFLKHPSQKGRVIGLGGVGKN